MQPKIVESSETPRGARVSAARQSPQEEEGFGGLQTEGQPLTIEERLGNLLYSEVAARRQLLFSSIARKRRLLSDVLFTTGLPSKAVKS